MRRGVVAGLVAYAAVLVAFTAAIAVPFVTKERDIPAEVPSPPPLSFTDLDVVRGGGRLCMTDAAISAESRQMRFKLGTYGRPGPPLAVTVRGAQYRAARTVATGYPDNSTLAIDLPRPGHSQLVTVCVRNRGRSRIAFYAASDRAESRVHVFTNGKRVAPTPMLSFNEAHPTTIAKRAGVTAGRIAVFRGFLDHAWIVWTVAFLTAIGVPLLIGLALAAAARRD